MALAELATNLGIVAAILVSLGVIWTKGVKPMFKFLHHIAEIHEIIQELKPNGGESLKDDVTYLRKALSDHLEDERLHNHQ